VKPVDTPVHVFVADGNLDTISSMLYEEESGRCRVCCIFKFAESALRTWTTMEMERDNEKNMGPGMLPSFCFVTLGIQYFGLGKVSTYISLL
jgi:hypothetical protein